MFGINKMKPNPSVAVVILNWNGKHYLQKYLPSVMASTYQNVSVIIADNHSTDDSIDFITQNYPSVRIIQLDENYGFSKGYNLALKKVDADYYVLLNSDVEVTPDWIEPVIDLMESNERIAACQPKILAEKNKDQFEYAGASGGWIDRYGYPFCRGRIFDFCEIDHGQYNDVSQVFWASGAAMFVRSAAFHECKGLDESFFAHQEEIDLCWRLQNKGYQIFVQPTSVVYHLGGGSLEQGNKRKVFLNFRNNLLLLYKNLSKEERKKIIPYRHFLNIVAAFQFVLKGEFENANAIIKATSAYYKMCGEPKNAPLSNKRLSDLAGVYQGSIVKEFFIKKKKRFSEIVKDKK